jgi:excisionase family DNA binding protein
MSQSTSETVEQHYTVAEVAALLRVHQMTVRNWYSKKGLHIQRVGKQGIRIANSDLKTFLEAFNKSTPTFMRALGNSGATVATRRSGSHESNENSRKEELQRNTGRST